MSKDVCFFPSLVVRQAEIVAGPQSAVQCPFTTTSMAATAASSTGEGVVAGDKIAPHSALLPQQPLEEGGRDVLRKGNNNYIYVQPTSLRNELTSSLEAPRSSTSLIHLFALVVTPSFPYTSSPMYRYAKSLPSCPTL